MNQNNHPQVNHLLRASCGLLRQADILADSAPEGIPPEQSSALELGIFTLALLGIIHLLLTGAPEVIRELLGKAPEVRKIWAGGGYSGPELAGKLKRLQLADHIEIVGKPKNIKGFTMVCRRWVVERTFAWMSCCRSLSKDHERSLSSSQAWV